MKICYVTICPAVLLCCLDKSAREGGRSHHQLITGGQNATASWRTSLWRTSIIKSIRLRLDLFSLTAYWEIQFSLGIRATLLPFYRMHCHAVSFKMSADKLPSQVIQYRKKNAHQSTCFPLPLSVWASLLSESYVLMWISEGFDIYSIGLNNIEWIVALHCKCHGRTWCKHQTLTV